MLPYVIGIGFLVACLLGVPLLQKLSHERLLKGLRMEGATRLPRLLGLSGVRIERPAWRGEVAFEPARLGGGRPGHLRLLAEFARPLRLLRENAPIRTGDEQFDQKIAVEGDPAFAKKFLVP